MMARFSPPLSPRSARARAATATASGSGASPSRSTSNSAAAATTTTSPTLRVTTADMSSGSASTSHYGNGSPHSHFARSKSDMGLTASGSSSSNSNTAGGPQASTSGSGTSSGTTEKRGRSSSILSIHEIKENYDDALDQSAMANLNADWVNYKGAWLIHIVLIVVGKILVDSIPGIEQDTSWTIVLQGYLLATYLMFHFVEGVPFESNSGVWDRLTMWEQIDGGAQYTPAKKWLTILPVGLFLLSTHYTRYDHHPALFSLNIISLVALALIPKLPQLHRQRVTFGAPKSFMTGDHSTGTNTPVEISMQRAHLPSLPE